VFRILHLSDLHIRTKSTWSTTPILNDAKRVILDHANEENVDVVAFTGDIAFSGKPDEYEIAQKWLEQLCFSTGGLNIDQREVMIVPGNHDVDRKLISPPASAIEEQLKSAKTQSDVAAFYTDEDSKKLLSKRHTAFYEFCRNLTGTEDLAQTCWSRVFEFKDRKIRFDGLDTSWLCRGEDDKNRLLVGQPQLSELLACQEECDVAFTLAHHPLSHLMEFDETNTIAHLRRYSSVFLRGHLHQADSLSIDSPRGGYIELAAGALHEHYERPNRFSIVDISDDFSSLLVRTFVWDKNEWIIDRNLVNSDDGIARFDLPPLKKLSKPTTTPPNKFVSIVDGLSKDDDELGEDGNENSAQEILAAFPRFQGTPSRSDRAVRQDALASAIRLMAINRVVEIRKDPGAKSKGFISCICEDFQRQAPDSPVLTVNCADVSTGKLLQESIEFSARATVPIFAVAIQESERCLLVLEDLDEVGEQEAEKSATINGTIGALLDFCPNLSLVRTSSLPLSNEQNIRVGALDEADTRAYLDSKTSKSSFFDSHTDYSRVHRATSGLPVYLDDVVDALTVTNLEGALVQQTVFVVP